MSGSGSSGSGSAEEVAIGFRFHWALILLLITISASFIGCALYSCVKKPGWFHFDDTLKEDFMTGGVFGSKVQFVIRLVFFIFSFATLISTAATTGWNMKYYTNWNFTLVVIVMFLLTVQSVFNVMLDRTAPEWLTKMTWVLWHIEISISVLVTIIFWILLSDGSTGSFSNFAVHALNMVIMLLEFLPSNMLMRGKHCIFVALFVIFYVVCIYMNEAANPPYFDGDMPYFFMDTYPDPNPFMAFVWYLGLWVLHFVIFYIVFGISKLKERFWRGPRDAVAEALEMGKVNQV